MEFSRQEYWSGLPFPSPGDLPNPETEPTSPALEGRFFTTSTSWETWACLYSTKKLLAPCCLQNKVQIPETGDIRWTYNPLLEHLSCLGASICKLPISQALSNPLWHVGQTVFHLFHLVSLYLAFPDGSDGKRICLQGTRPGFNPWVRKIPWRTEWQPTPVFLPGEFHDRGAWWATVYGVAKSWTRLRLSLTK